MANYNHVIGGTDMENAVATDGVFRIGFDISKASDSAEATGEKKNLLQVEPGTYIVKEIDTDDEDMNAFLFRLGCYSGEPITVISRKKKSCIVVIKDGRYSLDELLASAIIV